MPNYRNNPNYSRMNMPYPSKDNMFQRDLVAYNSNMSSKDSEVLSDLPLAMAYVPFQEWKKTYDLNKILSKGTLFPDLFKPFEGGKCK